MKDGFSAKIIPAVLAVAGVILIIGWLGRDVASDFESREPGADRSGQVVTKEVEPIEIVGELVAFDLPIKPTSGSDLALPGDWPGFRGANFDAIIDLDIKLAEQWPPDGPEVFWSIDVGEGYAGAAVLNGRVYVLDYDRENKADVVRCMSLADGNDIWRYSYPVKVKRNHGMSRTVPSVTEEYIVTLGPKCHVTCLDPVTGEFKWMINLVREFNTTVPQWYAGQCPLIVDDKAIIALGGDALMMAVDCNSGEILWETSNPNEWKMTHSSILPIEFMGKKMYVYCGSKGVVGVSAEDGAVLWETNEWKISIANVPTPVLVGDGLIFLSGGYEAGAMMLKLSMEGERIVARSLFKLEADVFGSAQQTPIFYKGYIYGVRPDGQLVCLDLQGNEVWDSTGAEKFGLGPYTIINGLIYVMDDSGLLSVAKASPAGFEKLTQGQVLHGHDSWGPMAVAGRRLILRDMSKMICIDIAEPDVVD